MRNYISIIFATLLTLTSCVNNDVELDQQPEGSSRIVISAKSLGITTRSADTDIESSLALVDVYVMDEARNIVYSERIDKSSSPLVGGGEFVLRKNRDEFAVGEKFFVYMIANSTAPLSEATTWEELCEMTQTDENIHLSGIEGSENPDFFLMDGFAYLSEGGNDKAPDEMTAYVINDGVKGKDVFLNGTLYRAAAKIVVTLTQGSSVEFHKVMDNSVPLYSFYQLPISTLVVRPEEGVAYNCQKQTTDEVGLNADSFQWSEGEDGTSITLIGYAYANDWSKQTANESSLLLNIPMMWNKDGSEDGSKEAASPVNWYKIPISKESRFERNKCYVINVNINAIGAGEKNTPLEINNAEYVTLDWQKVNVGIGQNEAKYLTLNMEVVKIYNTNFDLDQLTFTSSSPIKSIKLKDVFSHNVRLDSFQSVDITKESDGETATVYEEGDGVYAYYIDKFGQKIQLGTDPNFDIKITEHPELTKAEVLQRELNLYQKEGADVQHIRAEVAPGQERQLNGDIHIYSPINAVAGDADLDWNSHFNTIRYLEFEVMNEQGLVATFRVEQIPLSVIKNEPGFYSFRDDHVLTDDPNDKPFDYFNYVDDFHSFMTSAMYLVHPHDFTDEPTTEEWLNTPISDRDYSWMFNPGHYPWLHNDSNQCPAQGTEDLMWVEISYGFFDNVVYYDNGTKSKTFSGIHKPAEGERPYRDYFYRGMYRNLPGEYAITNSSYKGTALSPYYEAEVIDKDGNKVKRIFRDHYRWNAQPIFWSKFTGEYYDEPMKSKYYSGQSRKKGQTDIHEYGPSQDGGKTWGKFQYSTNLPTFANHRMYNITTTSTSSEYLIGFPRLTENGTTENSDYNANIVSPNLVLASQLGETNHQQFLNTAKSKNYIIPDIKKMYTVAERHCKEYVETTFVDTDGNNKWTEGEEIIEYHDWRLPTAAEIEMIIEFQADSRAMDKVLDAQYYYCITGTADSDDLENIHNWVSREIPGFDNATSTGYYIRCVRDVNRKK